jgi:hypothetical protein
MMPVIDVSESTYKALESLAKPFTDKSPEDVIRRLIAEHSEVSARPTGDGIREYRGSYPNLAFTKILSASIGGVVQKQPNWNRLMEQAIRLAGAKLKDPKELSKVILANNVVGEKTDHGYAHFPQLGISVQGQDSNGAWKAIAHIAKILALQIEVVFEWADTPKAANPGQVGKFRLNIG